MATQKNTSESSPSQKSRIFLTSALELINTPLVLDERLDLIAKIIATYLSVDDVSLFLKEEESDMLVLRVSYGLDPMVLGKLRVPIGKGITGIVAETKQYIATRNILEDPRNEYSVYAEDEEFPSVLSFPILWEDELVGTANIRSRTERDFTAAEAEELSTFTTSIAGSIKNAQQYESLEYRSRLLELTIKIAGSISSSLDLDIIMDDIAWEIANGFKVNGVMIHLFSDDGTLRKVSSDGLKAGYVQDYPLNYLHECIKTGKPTVRVLEDEKPFGDFTESAVTCMCLPMTGQKRIPGTISLFRIDDSVEEQHRLLFSHGVDVLLHIGALSALAVENALIHSEVKRLSDELQHKYGVIETLYSRMSAMFDTIDSGIIATDENGIIRHFNTVAGKALNLTSEAKGTVNIDTVTSYKPPLTECIEKRKDLTNRVVTFIAPAGNFAAVLTIRYYSGASGEQKGSVISFRPMEETVKLLSRFNSQRPRYTFEDIIGHSTTLQETVRLARLAAQTSSTVLIVGESGTGKELFSQAIHNASQVADGPFIAVNCAAIPKELIESELFGYAEGAFTGARKGGYIGKFEQATGGTMFLDEVGDMPLDLQVKLLRVLQEKVIQRVGSEHVIPISTRVIAATNKDLKKAIAEGEFREELYWRLNVLTIEIPPLRNRKLDIPEFVDFFVKRFSKENNRTVSTIEPAFIQKLMEIQWQGNIRQLEHTIEHAVLVAQSGRVTVHDLPQDFLRNQDDDARENIEQAREDRIESSRKLYREAILSTGGDVNAAAKKLGMSRATIYRRLKKYGLTGLVSKIKRGTA